MTEFRELVASFGLVVSENDMTTLNRLSVDQRKFQSSLQEYLSQNGQAGVSTILDGYKSYMDENESNFLMSLMPTSVEHTVSTHSSTQDSLLKLLLELDQLQLDLFDYLIPRLLEYSEDSSKDVNLIIMNAEVHVPTYIINQFRYQPKIVDADQLCRKLMELINSVSKSEVKRELIACIPDILSDCEHNNLVNELEELLDDTELISSTLDTLSNLKFRAENTQRIVDKLFAKYAIISETDLPSTINFILKAVNSLSAQDIFARLRLKLNLDEIEDLETRFRVFDIVREYFHISNQLIDFFFNVLSSSITRQIRQDDEEEEDKMTDETETNQQMGFRPIDFCILTILYTLPQHYKQADKVFKQALKEEPIKNLETAIETTLKLGKSIVNEMFDPLTNVAKSLIINLNAQIYSIGQFIYKKSFENVDKRQKHSLIQILIDHITCSSNQSRDNSLDVLIDLCSNNQLVPFSLELKSLLNYIEYFNLGQIRKVYFVLCSIAYASLTNESKTATKSLSVSSIPVIPSSFDMNSKRTAPPSMSQHSHQPEPDINPSSIQDQLHILINKQLSSNVLKFKQIGVIGALMILKNMSSMSQKTTNQTNANNQSSLNDTDDFFSCSSTQEGLMNNMPSNSTKIGEEEAMHNILSTEIRHIWQMVIDSSRSSPESLGLFADNLSSLLSKGSIKSEFVEILIKENVKQMSKLLFKLNPEEHLNQLAKTYSNRLARFKISYEFGIDDHSRGALNLLTQQLSEAEKRRFMLLGAKSDSSEISFTSPMVIPATFRLFASLERNNIQALKDYLGMPILSIRKDLLYKYGNFSDDTGSITSSLDMTNSESNLFNQFKYALSDEERKLICDSAFYLINWFIELINAFSVEIKRRDDPIEEEISRKLVQRLKGIQELQQILVNLLPYMKFYRPPLAAFGLVDSSVDELPYVHTLIKVKEVKSGATGGGKRRKSMASKKKGKTAKKSKKNTDEDGGEEINELEEDENQIDDEEKENIDETMAVETTVTTTTTAEVDLNKLNIYFREFDLTVISLVNLELDLTESKDEISSSFDSISINSTNNKSKIKPSLLDMILSDFNKKFMQMLKISDSSATPGPGGLAASSASSNKLTKTQLFLQLNHWDSKSLLSYMMNSGCFESICAHMERIDSHVRQIQEKYDGLKDPNELCNNPKNIALLKCLNHLIKLVRLLFTWLNSNNEIGLIKEIIKKLSCNKTSGDKQPTSLATQIDKVPELYFYNYVAKLDDVILDLNTMQELIQFLDLLCNKIMPKQSQMWRQCEKKFRLILIETCREFLFSDYNIKVNGIFSTRQASNESVKCMLNILLANQDENQSLDLVEKMTTTICSQEFMEDRQSCENTFNTLKLHFLSYYKTFLEYTVTGLKFIEKHKYHACNEATRNELMSKMERLVTIHSSLVMLKKHVAFKEINILSVLKCSRLFLTSFLKYEMPWLDKAFDDYREQVVLILEHVQKSVFFLQEICLTNTQFAVVKQTPVYMRCAEAFSFRIKQLFFVNNVDQAFSVNLFQNKPKPKETKKKGKEKKSREPERTEEYDVDEEPDEEEGQDDELDEEETEISDE